jgi:MFS transporter, DHA1 family, tetracycline resistance protein
VSEPAADPGDAQVTVLGRGRRKAALGFIFTTALLDIISMGIMIPVLPNLIKEMVGGDTATATHMTGWFAITWGAMQFLCSPIQGMLSDRFGRRPVLLISIFGLTLDFLFMALAPTLLWLYVGRVLNGITAASFSTAGAYIADVSAPEDRAKNFGLMGAAFGLGFIIGPALGGFLGEIDLRLPFYFAAGLGFINWLYGFFVLPESLPPERREKKFLWRKANPLGSFRLLASRQELLGLAGVNFLWQLAHNVFPSIFVLYVGHRYGWSPLQTGLLMMAVGAANVVVQAALVGRAVKAFGERGVILLGLSCAVVGFSIYGVAQTGWGFMAGIPFMALSALAGPGLQGLMSRRVEPWEQGQLQGANSGIIGVTAVVGPQVFTGIFAWSVAYRESLAAGAPLYLAAFMALAALGLAMRAAKAPRPEPAIG